MRILYISCIGKVGGAERSLRELIGAIVAAGDFQTRLVMPPEIPEMRLHRPGRRTPKELAAIFRARKNLRGIINSWQPQIIHCNTAAALLAVPLRTPCPVVASIRDVPKYPLLLRRADELIAISDFIRSKLSRGTVIKNGIDFSALLSPPMTKAEARAALGLKQDAKIFGVLANFVPWKQHAKALEIAAACGAEAVFAGEDLFGEHPEYVASLPHVIGRVEPRTFLRAIDALVHTAPNEPFGCAVLEARVLGTPVINAGSGGVDEILREELENFSIARVAEETANLYRKLAQAADF